MGVIKTEFSRRALARHIMTEEDVKRGLFNVYSLFGQISVAIESPPKSAKDMPNSLKLLVCGSPDSLPHFGCKSW